MKIYPVTSKLGNTYHVSAEIVKHIAFKEILVVKIYEKVTYRTLFRKREYDKYYEIFSREYNNIIHGEIYDFKYYIIKTVDDYEGIDSNRDEIDRIRKIEESKSHKILEEWDGRC